MKEDEFAIVLSSNLNFEGMVVEINFINTPIARLDYENGTENIEIDLFLQDTEIDGRKMSLSKFLDAVSQAKDVAIQCAKEDATRNQSGTMNIDPEI